MNDCTSPQDHGRGKLTQVACAFIADFAASQEGARSSMAVELNERLAVWPRCRRNPDDEPLFPRGAEALFTCGAPQSMSSTATTRRLEAAVGAPAAPAACRGNVGLARTGRGGHGADGADSVAMRTPALNESAGD